ncbi:Fc receptor-like protein 1 isoform X2 [Corvus hawaiiensis]|uniref:Fc receptor-like protein 1 isoform X2 n=1 Tax=Corvus hawaiiensis TaxID=134902 RepID=UPI0020193211|nr:Fc receptor-like protein 1 isoform X2 [Corvus hawaiiensis]
MGAGSPDSRHGSSSPAWGHPALPDPSPVSSHPFPLPSLGPTIPFWVPILFWSPPHPSPGVPSLNPPSFLGVPSHPFQATPRLPAPSSSQGSPRPSPTLPGSFTVLWCPPPTGVPLSGVSVSAQPPGGQVALGDRLVLNCTVAAGTGLLSFSWHRGDLWALLGTGPHLELRHVGDNDSGHYQCRASNGDSVAESVPLNVTVLVPVANATISPGALAQPVRAGDPVTLRCSVQVGSAPVTFTWLRNGSEVAQGPLLELGDVHVGHSGTYQCMATNQLGQDGHRVFRALSPELALTVTPRAHWDTAVAVNIGRSLLFLVLLLGVIGGCHWWQRLPARKPQDRSPQPLSLSAPPRVSPGPAPPRHPQVTNVQLPGPYEGQQDPGATDESVM